MEEQVCQGGQRYDQSASHFGQERTHGCDDGFVAVPGLKLVVLDRVDDGDHHDEIEAVQTQVDQHVSDRDHDKTDGICRHDHASDNLQHTSDHDHDHAEGHQLFAHELAGQGRIDQHQDRCRGDTDHREDGVQAAFVSVAEIDKAGADSAEDEGVGDLLEQEDQDHPAQLIVLGDCTGDPADVELHLGLHIVAAVFLDAEEREEDEERSEDRDHKRDDAISSTCTAAEGLFTGGEDRDQDGRECGADAGEEGRAGRILVPEVRVAGQGRDHAPERDVVHGVGNAVGEIDNAKENDKRPSLQLRVEGQVDDDGGRQDADQEPGLEFAPFCTGALDDVAHDRIVQSVKNTGSDHDSGDGQEL